MRLFDIIPYHMISYGIIWYKMISYALIWFHVVSFEIIWFHSFIWYSLIYHDVPWPWHDFTSTFTILDSDSWSDAIFGPYVLRCCETLWDVMRSYVMLCGVVRCCVVLWLWSSRVYTSLYMFIWFMYVHVIYDVTDPNRLLEPFSGSEVQRCARWSCGYLESSSLELRK